MKRWFKILISAGLSALISADASAEVRILCQVAYKDNDGFYTEYEVLPVSFMTGFELRESTGSLRYDWDDIYAIVQRGVDEVAILSLDTAFALAGPAELNLQSVKTIFGAEPVVTGSQEFAGEKRRWRIKARDTNGVWIDSRVD